MPREIRSQFISGHAESKLITTSQLRAIRILAERNEMDLKPLLEQYGGSKPVEQLTTHAAARLIAELNSSRRLMEDCVKH